MPFEDAPQIKKLPESSQNSGVLKAREDPAFSRLGRGLDRGLRRRSRFRRGALLGGGLRFRYAVGPQAQPGRVVAHKEEDRGQDEERDRRQVDRTLPPADGDDEPHQSRHGDELTGGGGGPEDAEDEAPALDEPAVGDRGTQDGGDDTGAHTADDAPEQVKLPELGHRGAGQSAPADKGDPYERDPLRAETVHQPTGNGAGEPVEKEPYRGGERDRRPAPPELRLQRIYKNRRCRPHPSRDQEREEHD